jgi:cell division transport system permease protein
MSLAAKGVYFWRTAAQGIRHAPFVHFIAVTTIAIALFTAGLARGGGRLLDGLISSFGGEVELTAYLAPGTSPDKAAELAATLEKRTGGKATVVLPELALARLSEQLGDLGGALKDLPENPLPISVEVSVPPEARAAENLRGIAEKTRQLEMVTGVDYGEEAVERLSAIADALRYGGLIAFAIVVVTTIVIVSATLQLAIYARREEIEIQKLVGATDRFVKIPFLIEGLLQGLLGSLLAVGALVAFSAVVGPHLTSLFTFLASPKLSTRLVDARLVIELLTVGCTLGLSGSFIAVGRFLRV